MIDKKITVIMHTNGEHPPYIGAAVNSILNQTYKDFTLLINHNHPYRYLSFEHPVGDNVRIIHRPYKSFIEQMAASFKHINTPYWCVVDSDDWVVPDHLEQLMELRENADESINCVGLPMILKTVKGVPQKLIRAGWVRFLYNYIDPDIIAELAQNYERQFGFDQAIDMLPVWRRYIAGDSFDATYMYRRYECNHVSNRKSFKKRTVKRIGLIKNEPFPDDHDKFLRGLSELSPPPLEDEQTIKRLK